MEVLNDWSSRERERLHKELDKLLDQKQKIQSWIENHRGGFSAAWDNDSIRYECERLSFDAIHLAADVSGNDARNITLQHTEPTGRDALRRFLRLVAAYAPLGSNPSFLWQDVTSVIEALEYLDCGTVSEIFQPKKVGTGGIINREARKRLEQAALWTFYLDALHGKGTTTANITEIAKAFGLTVRRVQQGRKEARANDWLTLEIYNVEKAGQNSGFPHSLGEPPELPFRPPMTEEELQVWCNRWPDGIVDWEAWEAQRKSESRQQTLVDVKSCLKIMAQNRHVKP
jgi:hypothetical protein